MKRTSCSILFSIILLTACASESSFDVTSLNPFGRDKSSSETTLETGAEMSPRQKALDVRNYTLRHEILIDRKAIAGSAVIEIRSIALLDQIELDFDSRFKISSVKLDGVETTYTRTDGKLFVAPSVNIPQGKNISVEVTYRGRPHVAERAPWSGGFVWDKTPSGDPWVATAIQGEGCDVWWPCIDHPSVEADSIDLYITVPTGLEVAANGLLISTAQNENLTTTFHWHSDFPTNDYGVALNIAPYKLIERSYTSTNGNVFPVMFWYLPGNEEAAQKLFDQNILPAIEFFERKLGPYPWAPEKAGFVETPYYGMEHQTIIAYGAEYKFDGYPEFALLHHEFAHEWFGNKVTVNNWADFWLHEGFASYMQPVYTEETRGKAAFNAEMFASYRAIKNCNPLAPYGNFTEGAIFESESGPQGDIYNKSAWVLHTLRTLIGDDAFWNFMRLTVYGTTDPNSLPTPLQPLHRTTDDLLALANQVSGTDLSWFFEVYVRHASLPELEITETEDKVLLSWKTENDLPFPMPIPIQIESSYRLIEMQDGHASLSLKSGEKFVIDPEMGVLRHLPFVERCEKPES